MVNSSLFYADTRVYNICPECEVGGGGGDGLDGWMEMKKRFWLAVGSWPIHI